MQQTSYDFCFALVRWLSNVNTNLSSQYIFGWAWRCSSAVDWLAYLEFHQLATHLAIYNIATCQGVYYVAA